MNKFILILSLLLPFGVAEAQSIKADRQCVRSPQFPEKFGFENANSALSTSETHVRGLILIDNVSTSKKSFQHPSWNMAGWLGGMIFDDHGTVFTFAVPHVELTYNPPAKQNTLYKVDSESGAMSKWIELPTPYINFDQNVFGILGITYSCFANSIYVSSVMGSSRTKELGVVYQLNASSGKILSRLENFDGFGLATAELNGKHVLLLGNARNSNLYSVALSETGELHGRPEKIFSILGVGPRGDDKIKKIVVNESEQSLQLTGFEFNFNLSATLEKQESVYRVTVRNLHNN